MIFTEKRSKVFGRCYNDLGINYTGGFLIFPERGIVSLKDCPIEVSGVFNCQKNKLITLEGGPTLVHSSYNCDFNPLISLKGAPRKSGFFNCTNCELTSLEYAPKMIMGSLFISYNKISSFKNIFEHIHEINGLIDCSVNPIKEGLLQLLLIKGVQQINSPYKEIDGIINKYLKTHTSGSIKTILNIQKLIIEAKLKDVPESVYME